MEAISKRALLLAKEHQLAVIGLSCRGAIAMFGDETELAFPSLVHRLFGDENDIGQLKAYLTKAGSPRIFSQGTTTGTFGLLGQKAVYAAFFDTTLSAIEQFRVAKQIHGGFLKAFGGIEDLESVIRQ